MPHPCTTEAGIKLRGADKVARVPIPVARQLRKPEWIRAAFRGSRSVRELTDALRANRLHTVCEEANCPNLGECFARGTATFMIMGAICTRRCPSCDVGHGRPRPLDPAEPKKLADTVRQMQMGYVVITSVNRDDLRDGGARHFAECIREVRAANPGIVVEVLTPDFRGRVEPALELLATEPPDVFNHNIETVPSRYRELRPGADYRHSLDLLARFKARHPGVATKSGLMLGVGETREEIEATLIDLRAHDVDRVTIGQYLQPSLHHLPVRRYVAPAEFDALRRIGEKLGFRHVASGPLVRSSYHADLQACGLVGARARWMRSDG
ncbi:MAG: lipoyl synthase [Rhodocyclaceae bacterium]|nr:lipoyl synthase [Rhodocyclaceae bacterium]